MAAMQVKIPHEELAAVCRRYHVKHLALFGSVLRDDFRAGSDIDVLVEFERDHTPGLSFFALQDELSDLFGRRVDLNTPAFLSPRFRASVLSSAQPIYAAP